MNKNNSNKIIQPLPENRFQQQTKLGGTSLLTDFGSSAFYDKASFNHQELYA